MIKIEIRIGQALFRRIFQDRPFDRLSLRTTSPIRGCFRFIRQQGRLVRRMPGKPGRFISLYQCVVAGGRVFQPAYLFHRFLPRGQIGPIDLQLVQSEKLGNAITFAAQGPDVATDSHVRKGVTGTVKKFGNAHFPAVKDRMNLSGTVGLLKCRYPAIFSAYSPFFS